MKSCAVKILHAAHPALAKIIFVSALEWELALQWPEGKHLSMQKHCIWIKYQEKKQFSETPKIYLNILF